MWIKHGALGLFGLAAGSAVAAGTFAFIIMLGVIPRMIGRSKTAQEIIWYENMIIIGGIWGNLSSVYTSFPCVNTHLVLILYGLSAGIYVGCNAMALAETLKTFPIMYRRLALRRGIPIIITCFALGKATGSLVYYIFDLAK